MKLGVHLSTFTPRWEEDVLPWIPEAARIGYRAVELPLMFPERFDRAGAKALLKRHGLACTCGTGMNPEEDLSSPDPGARDRGLRRLQSCLDICCDLESDCLGGVLYAPWGQRFPREKARDRRAWALEGLRKTADYARGRGVTLSLELLNRYESYFVNTVEEGKALLAEVGRENVKLHFDTFHAHVEEQSLPGAIRLGGGDIWHVHLCDNNRAAPGSGAIDFGGVLDALAQIGYRRFLMVENFVVPDCPAGDEVCIWRRVFPSPLEDARAAFRHMAALMEERGLA